jgi:hypothetical protein
MWGCGGSGATSEVCRSTSRRLDPPTGRHGRQRVVRHHAAGGPRDVSNFVIKNIEGTGYGGGPDDLHRQRHPREARSLLDRRRRQLGRIRRRRIYFHDNDYSNLCANEHYVAVFGDDENHGCAKDHEIRNSKIVQDNRFTINDDSDSWGGGDTSRAAAGTSTTTASTSSRTRVLGPGMPQGLHALQERRLAPGRLAEEAVPDREQRLHVGTSTTDQNFPWFIHTECIGECGPYNPGLGEFWFYGNIFHYRAGAAGRRSLAATRAPPTGPRHPHLPLLLVQQHVGRRPHRCGVGAVARRFLHLAG